MNNQYRRIPLKQQLLNALAYIVCATVMTLIYLSSITIENYYKQVAYTALSRLMQVGMANFYFQTYINGKANLTDLFTIYFRATGQGKIFVIVLVQLVINMGLNLMSQYFPLNTTMGVIMFFFFGGLGILFAAVNYLYSANDGYEVKDYFRMSYDIMRGNFFRYQFMVILAVIAGAFAGAVIALTVAGSRIVYIGGNSLYALALIPVGMMLATEIATARFMAGIIPYGWY